MPGQLGSLTAWEEASEKAREFVAQLSLDEKIGIASGGYSKPQLQCVGSVGPIERLGFGGMCFSDGPAGYSRSDSVSVFPSGITVAASWDRRLMYERAVAIGEEFRDKGAHVHLGPSAGPIGRHALGGRNWESFGPDPFLAGVAMNASVSGIQSTGVQACSKHYIGNEQETQRTLTVLEDGTKIDAVSSNIDNRTLHELYIWPFADAVRAGTASIMCSYNRVNGNYSCANPETLSILKEELAFPGYVVSDWYATHSTADSANAGLDLEMPGNVSMYGETYFSGLPVQAVVDNVVSEKRLNEMAERVLRPYYFLGQDSGYPSVDPASGPVFAAYQYGHKVPLIAGPLVAARDVRGEHPSLIRELGAAATVLLKNTNGTLPLKDQKQIGVFGNGAPYPTIGSAYLDLDEGFGSYEVGTVDIGGGSGTVRHTELISLLEAIQKHVREQGSCIQALLDNSLVANSCFRTIYPIPDVCLVFLKAYASEGVDRKSLDLDWNATQVVESTAAVCPNTVVIVHAPGTIVMPWAENKNVTAILLAHYPGEETGNSIVDVLWGAIEPAGRLPYTIPKSLTDYGPPIVNLTEPTADRNAWQADFTEGQLIDYRHFDANNIEPHFEFGFSLSYAEFDMAADLQVTRAGELGALADASRGKAPGGLKDLWSSVASASVKITNSGSVAGSTVPQLYVAFPQDSTPKGTPVRVLRGFEKVHLEAGQSAKVVFNLNRRDVSYWDDQAQQWVIPSGTFVLSGGFSSRDLRANTSVSLLSF
ncbi:hypothetical protein ColKHC_06580 [Colletotrichum higginsianum]|nr:hypothetical protein ColKHC_06580 [Colletotrichum higginsianum]